MTVKTVRSEAARMQWRETVEAAYVDRADVVIERYGKPIVTVVSYARWQELLKRLKEFELTAQVTLAYQAMQTDPTSDVSEEEYQQLLEKAGLAV